RTKMMHVRTMVSRLAAALLVTACATAGVGGSSAPVAGPTPTGTSTGSAQTRGWRVAAEEHVDLWLHGFALLTSDTGHVPFFARGPKLGAPLRAESAG